MKRLKRLLCYADLEPEEYKELIPIVRQENVIPLRTYSMLALFIFVALVIADSAVYDYIAPNLPLYAIMALLNAFVAMGAWRFINDQPKWILPLAYLFMAALYSFSLCLTLMHPEYPSVTTIVLMFALPFLVTDRPLNLILLTILVLIGLIATALRFKLPGAASMDVWNGLSFGAVACVVEVMQQRSRFAALMQARKISYLSETDTLTGAKNRNKYESCLEDYAGRCMENVICVYSDVNGLHELNDLKGHKAGDSMLIAVSHALIGYFGADNTYRIGGDEFVAFCVDSSEEEVLEALADITASLEKMDYHLSAGISCAEKEGLNMSVLINQAELKMYRAKQDYYAKTGKDRRRH